MASRDPQRPNVLFVLSDDQGPWALGAAGNDEIITPNLDRLADAGVYMRSFFCVSPVCSPARASLLTGRIPSAHGVQDALHGGMSGPGAVQFLAGQLLYTDLLANAGYACGLIGKWHLGDSGAPPKSISYWYTLRDHTSLYRDVVMVRADADGVREAPTSGYSTEVFTDAAVAYLDDQSGDDRPFHLSVHYTAPHSPWLNVHPVEYLRLYEPADFGSCPQSPAHPWTRPPASDWPALQRAREDPRASLAGYFAAVTAMDAGVGRILDKLDVLGLRESTLVCFLSDNGFCAGHHGVWGKGNGTLPQNMYEESVRVPAIFSQPGRIPSGRVDDALVSGYDIRPTVLDYLGVPDTQADQLPGRSFAPLLLGESSKAVNEQVVVFSEYGSVRMIRTTEWKYIHRYPHGPHELYHLTEDPGERANLADDPAREAVGDELRRRLRDWFLRYVTPRLDGVYQPNTGRGQIAPITGSRSAFRREPNS